MTQIEDHLEKIGLNNNVIIGNGNQVAGEDNIITGDGNQLKGDDNWIISRSNFESKGTKENFLIFKNWVIDLDEIEKIKTQPHDVIKTTNKIQGHKGSCLH